jgi:hypothetical protein
MAAQSRRAGCGCCGCFFAVLLVLFVLILLGVGFFYFNAANNLDRVAGVRLVPSPATAFNRQTYSLAREKFDRFFADPAERNVILSNAEVNALLADSPELRILRRGTAVVLSQTSAEVSCSLPLDLPLLPRRYLNCTFELRPSMRGQELELDVSRIEKEGKPLGPAEIHQYRFVVVPMIEKSLSSLNKIQGDRALRDIRIENGNLILSR